MRTGFCFLLLLLPLSANAAADLQKLQTARDNLTKAVEKIKPDPPSNADLDAAKDAVEALKTAIDAGADAETSDLDYAKAALAARKELRAQREYVDDRRAKVKIFDARRAIDAASKTLADAVKKIGDKDPSQADFDAVKTNADAVKKIADEARPFGKQDAKFQSYLGETDASVAKALKTNEDRQVTVAVEKQKAPLEAARAALKEALGGIQKGSTDEQFKAGDKAMADLTKVLEQGKPLEPKSKAYQGDADKARGELAAARKKMDEAFSATGLQKLKGEIEPAFKDLQAAQKPLRGKPSADQLSEARTAAIVVRGLVEKFAPEAQRSVAFGQYVEGVKKTLAEVESVIEQRTLANIQQDVVNARNVVDKKSPQPTDEQFAELNTAINVLEKQLEAVHKDEPLMAKAVGEASWLLKIAKETAAKRRIEVTSEKESKQLADATNDVTNAQKVVVARTPQPTDDQFQELNTAIAVLEKTIDGVHKDEPLMKRAVEMASASAIGAKDVAARRRIEVTSEIEQKQLLDAQKEVGIAQRNVEKKTPQPTDDQFAELNTAIAVLEKTLGTVHKDEPLMAKQVGESTWVVKSAKDIAAKRRLEVDVERQQGKTEEARKLAADALAQLNAPNFTQDQITATENAVKLILSTLDKGKDLIEKDKNYKWYDGEVRKRADEITAKIAAKKVQLAAREGGGSLADALATARAKIDTAKTPEGKDSDVEAAVASVDAITKALESQAALEKKDRNYAANAEKTRNALYAVTEQLEFAKLARELRKKTGEALMAGVSAVEAGQNMKDLRKRKGEYQKGVGLFRNCQSDGTDLTKMLPALTKLPVLVDGSQKSPREVMDVCAQRQASTETLLKEIAPLIKFEDGPKKSFESGKSLLDKGKKPEALKEYNECIATGIILRNDFPAMGDTQYDVGGSKMTLTEVINTCVEKRKSLLPAGQK